MPLFQGNQTPRQGKTGIFAANLLHYVLTTLCRRSTATSISSRFWGELEDHTKDDFVTCMRRPQTIPTRVARARACASAFFGSIPLATAAAICSISFVGRKTAVVTSSLFFPSILLRASRTRSVLPPHLLHRDPPSETRRALHGLLDGHVGFPNADFTCLRRSRFGWRKKNPRPTVADYFF